MRLTTRPMTASPRNSSRSLWPSTRVGFSLKYELWTNACAMTSRSRRTMPSRSRCSSTDGIAMCPSLLLVLLDVFDGVGDLLDLLGIFVRDLHAELLFEAHDQLDEVQRVRVEVLDERGLGSDLLLVDPELLDDELLETLERSAFGHRCS